MFFALLYRWISFFFLNKQALAQVPQNNKLQALYDDFNKIPDQYVKDALNNFRAELRSGGAPINFQQVLNSPGGDCYYQLFFDFPYIFVKVGNGTITSGDESVAEFQRLFAQFEACMTDKNLPVPDALKNGVGQQAAALVKKYTEQLISDEQSTGSNNESSTMHPAQRRLCPISRILRSLWFF